MKPRLSTLKPRVATLGGRLAIAAPVSGFNATPRERGRRWMKRRANWLSLHPLCCVCEAQGRVTVATQVDHRVPLWKGGADDEGNFQSLCAPDHDAKTAAEAAERAALGLAPGFEG